MIAAQSYHSVLRSQGWDVLTCYEEVMLALCIVGKVQGY